VSVPWALGLTERSRGKSPATPAPPPRPQVLDGFFDVDAAQGMADVYTWLRYSATRQLTWQRNYNTQPRTLSAAQARGERAARVRGHARRSFVGAEEKPPAFG
jgi:hypothetical protein